MVFKTLCWLGKLTGLPGLPMCRVYNHNKTEKYTLRQDGWVICESVNGKGSDMLPITMVSEKLIKKFEAELI